MKRVKYYVPSAMDAVEGMRILGYSDNYIRALLVRNGHVGERWVIK